MGPCLSLDELERLLEERLDPGESGAAGDHVEDCAICRGRLEGIAAAEAAGATARRAVGAGADASGDVSDFLRRLKAQGPPIGPAAGASPDASGLPGRLPTIAGFRIVREIGHGGMGVVYEATELALGRRVALKVLPAPMLADPGRVERFRREAEAAARLHHTNIVPVFGVGERDGMPFYVMPFIQGRGLDAVLEALRQLRDGGRADGDAVDRGEAADIAVSMITGLSGAWGAVPDSSTTTGPGARRRFARAAARTGVQVADALAHAHAQGILHRDIKPSNLLLDRDGTVRVTDFGLAKAIGDDGLTRTGDVVGTLRYMAPERFRGQGDARADVYSLGLTLYELLTLRPAFRGDDRAGLAGEVARDEPPRLRRLNPAVPADLETIVHKAMAREPAQRYATADAMAEDLRRFLDGRAIRARRVSAAGRAWRWCRRNRAVAGLIAAVFLLLAMVAGVATVGYVREAAERAEADRQRAVAVAAEQAMRRQWYSASVNLMQQAWDTGQLGRLRALLAETRSYPDRGFEWSYWQRHCHLERRTLVGHRAEVRAVAWSPDGRSLATGSMDGTARLWDAGDGRERLVLKGHMSQVTSVSWSPEGRMLATASMDGTARLWDAGTGRESRALRGHSGPVNAVAWSPDGRMLATGSADGTAKVWSTSPPVPSESREGEGRALRGHAGPVTAVAWSPDGRSLATASSDGTARVWEVADGRERLALRGHANRVVAVSWSPDGRSLATGSVDGTARLWDADDGRERMTLEGHTTGVAAVAWSPDGRSLATASMDGTAKVWDANGGRGRLALRGHTNKVWSVSWSPDGRSLATASADGTAKVWDAVEDLERLALRGHSGPVNAVAWSPDGQWLATASADGTAKVWDPCGARERLELRGHSSPVNAASWSPDGRSLATASADGTTKVWDVADGRERLTLRGHSSPVGAVSWSPDGHRLATGGWDGTVRVWDADDGRERRLLRGHTSGVRALAWSPDGRRLATAGADATAGVWDLADGRPRLILGGHLGEVSDVSWSPDGASLATASADATAKVWDGCDGRERLGFRGHTALVWSVSWSPDGRRLATGGEDGTAKVWDVDGGRELLTLRRHTGAIRSVGWSPDGRRLATGSEDGTARIWEAADLEAVRIRGDQDRAVADLLARNAFHGPHARGFLQSWLLLLPVAPLRGETGARALDRPRLPGEATARPRPGDRVTVGGRQLTWREHRSPGAVLDFNAVLGRVAERSIALAVCYLEADRRREGLWLQVGSDDQATVSVNGREVYRSELRRPLSSLDTVGPVTLEPGTNVLLFRVVNEGANWTGCVRLVDDAGLPAEGIRSRSSP